MSTIQHCRQRGGSAWGALVALALVGGVGFVGGRAWLETGRPGRAEMQRAQLAEVARLRDENAGLVAELGREKNLLQQAVEAVPSAAVSAQADRAEAVRALADLRKERRIWPTAFRRPGTPVEGNPAQFARLFALTAPQRVALQATFDSVRARVAEVSAAHSAMRRSDEHTVVIDVTPAPELAPWRETLRTALVAAVGAESLAAYDDLHGIEGILHEVGLDQATSIRTVTIKRLPDRGRYYVESEMKSVEGQSRSSSGSEVRDRAAMLARLGGLAGLVPGDF